MEVSTMKSKKLSVEEIIQKAITAQQVATMKRGQDAFKATERRLYAIPILEKKVVSDREKLEVMKNPVSSMRSMSVIRFQRNGYRVGPEEMLDAITQNLEATIAADEHEIATVKGAMEAFRDDPYYQTVTGRYIDRFEDEDIAAGLDCGTTQVWKQRTRLVRDISIMLYGATAL